MSSKFHSLSFLRLLRVAALNFRTCSIFATWQPRGPNRSLHQHYGPQNDMHRKIVPKVKLRQNTWIFLETQLHLWKLRLLWDPDFDLKEFIRGSKQAAIVMTDAVREEDINQISKFTTPMGFKQITRDLMESVNDARLKLIRFETEHLRLALPTRVALTDEPKNKICSIDMQFIALRNTKDFVTAEEAVQVLRILRQLNIAKKMSSEMRAMPHQIIFAQISIRFRRNYTNFQSAEPYAMSSENDWNISAYTIRKFAILNYHHPEF